MLRSAATAHRENLFGNHNSLIINKTNFAKQHRPLALQVKLQLCKKKSPTISDEGSN
jgi:hypothetical protein